MAITLVAPTDAAPFKLITLHSGTTYRTDFAKTRPQITVDTEEDAADLEREGWKRDAGSTKAARFSDHLLRKAVAAQGRHLGIHTRTEFGEVDAGGRHGRVMVAHDQAADVVSIHGVNADLSSIDPDLRAGFRSAAATFNAAQDSAEQSDAKALIGIVVGAVLDRHDFVGAQVRERKFSQRYRA